MNLAALIDAIPVVQSTADRTAKFPAPLQDQRVYNKGTKYVERFEAGAWLAESFVGGGPAAALGFFNGKDAAYGAKVDGATDDTAAWLAAKAAAEAVGSGAVYHPGGISRVSASFTTTAAAAGISIVGVPGYSVFRATGAAFGPMISITDSGGFGNRYGTLSGFVIDGNNIATVGLDLGVAVSRAFRDLVIQNCTSVGLRLRGTQNCVFEQVVVLNSGTTGTFDTNLLLDLGAATNSFVRCAFGQPLGKYNILCRRSAVPLYGLEQTDNAFYNCNVEGGSGSLVATIYARAGQNMHFYGCPISTTTGTVPGQVAFKADLLDGGPGTNGIHYSDCTFSGVQANVTLCSLVGVAPVIFEDSFVNGYTVGFSLDDTSAVEIVGWLRVGAVTTLVSPTGAKTAENLVTWNRVGTKAGQPSGVPVLGVTGSQQEIFDSTNNQLCVFNGAWFRVRMTLGVQVFTPANGGSVNPNAGINIVNQIVAGAGVASFTVNLPINTTDEARIVYDIYNNSGGALAVTFAAGYVLAGAFTNPANGQHRMIEFYRDNAAAKWRELSRSAADQAN